MPLGPLDGMKLPSASRQNGGYQKTSALCPEEHSGREAVGQKKPRNTQRGTVRISTGSPSGLGSPQDDRTLHSEGVSIAARTDLIGPVIIQDGLFGTGLRAHAYGARFRSCIDGIVHRSAEILILLLMSGSPELFTGCLEIKGVCARGR